MKSLDEFYKRRGNKPSSHCKPCSREYKKAWSAADPKNELERRRRYMRTYNYGLTASEQENILNVCQICGSEDALHYDHDHETGLFRGVLCRNHNLGLGMFGDDPELLLRAVDYLRQHAERRL